MCFGPVNVMDIIPIFTVRYMPMINDSGWAWLNQVTVFKRGTELSSWQTLFLAMKKQAIMSFTSGRKGILPTIMYAWKMTPRLRWDPSLGDTLIAALWPLEARYQLSHAWVPDPWKLWENADSIKRIRKLMRRTFMLDLYWLPTWSVILTGLNLSISTAPSNLQILAFT